MIEVKNLVKCYGSHTAVDHLNFTIKKGRIYGFLGPNGAGKSTTMNIMTGYLGATEGEVLINGHNILTEPYKAKKDIGYLPEQPPLYMDMTVLEYLKFVFCLKQLGKTFQEEQLEKIIRLVKLGSVRNRRKQEEQTGGDDSQISVTDIESLLALSYTDHSEGTTLSFAKDGDTWYVSNDRDIPLTQSYIETMEDTFCSLTATREISDPDALSDYGLEDPAYTIELTDQDGTLTTVTIGNSVDEDYYLAVNGQEDILYTADSSIVSSMQYDLDTMVAKDDVPSIGSGNLVQADITENGTTTIYSSDNDEQTETISTIAGGYGAMSLTELASYHADAEELASFGLDEDSRITVKLTYNESSEEESDEDPLTFTLYIGNTTDDDTRYVQVQDSDLVYLVSSGILNNLLGGSEE